MTTATKHRIIALIPVESSQLAAIGHCPETNTLAIQFAGKASPGSLYHYANFTAEQFTAFAGAESVGKHFYAHIKPHADRHPYQKIVEPGAVPGLQLPSDQSYSTKTFKDNGEPILLDVSGKRSVFCDLND